MEPLRASEPPCVLCEVRRDDDTVIPHDHLNGRAALAPCRPCFNGEHTACTPDPYWCSCGHPVCRERMT